MVYIKYFSELILPIIIAFFVLSAFKTKTDGFSAFSEGVKSSLHTVADIFPAVFTLMTAIGFLRSSGLLDFIIKIISPVSKTLGIPAAILPSALLRPLSGSGSIAMLSDILKVHGPDSFCGNLASVITGSTETTFYTIAVYFGAVSIKKSGPALKAALIADIVSITTSIIICKLLF